MKLFSVFTYGLIVLIATSCTAPAESKVIRTNSRSTNTISATPNNPNNSTVRPTVVSDELCSQLPQLKQFPGRDPEEKEDPVYSRIMSYGKRAIPCLVEEITNETPMEDPRPAPTWQNYVVGDTAIFLLTDLSKNDDLLVEMLPPRYREEWKTNGIYAYFNYVSKSENRRELQTWWRQWFVKQSK